MKKLDGKEMQDKGCKGHNQKLHLFIRLVWATYKCDWRPRTDFLKVAEHVKMSVKKSDTLLGCGKHVLECSDEGLRLHADFM